MPPQAAPRTAQVATGSALTAQCGSFTRPVTPSGLTEDQARALVRADVEPRDCFITDTGRTGWVPIDGTGCAHWVAHQRGIWGGEPGATCQKNHPVRVEDLEHMSTPVEFHEALPGDLFFWRSHSHVGLVADVHREQLPGPVDAEHPLPELVVRVLVHHDSTSRQSTPSRICRPGRGVRDNPGDWLTQPEGDIRRLVMGDTDPGPSRA